MRVCENAPLQIPKWKRKNRIWIYFSQICRTNMYFLRTTVVLEQGVLANPPVLILNFFGLNYSTDNFSARRTITPSMKIQKTQMNMNEPARAKNKTKKQEKERTRRRMESTTMEITRKTIQTHGSFIDCNIFVLICMLNCDDNNNLFRRWEVFILCVFACGIENRIVQFIFMLYLFRRKTLNRNIKQQYQ